MNRIVRPGRWQLLRTATTALVATAALVVASVVPANSAPAERNRSAVPANSVSAERNQSAAEKACETKTVATRVDGAEAMTDVAAALKSRVVTPRVAQSALKISEAKVYAIPSEQGTYTAAIVPIGAGYSLTSNFTVLFDEKSSIVQYTETYVSENAAGNFNITSYSDGKLLSSQDTDMPYMSDAQLQENSSTDTLNGTQSTRSCLAAVLGISGIFAGIIAAACWGACAAAAAGVGVPFCIACIAAYATIGGASITAIASCFK
ncbi:hypothetical protein [Micromonospora ureilytica]|uniref:hypothetical protein n=1 Tax=Micromonospora ureilytica TaxID=709868 RepID=UPI000F603959|nr:hypothetical protein [Micromonospora ureilytica]